MEDSERILMGKVAVITGAGRGIGRAIALGFGKAGAAVCCIARSSAGIDETVARIKTGGGEGLAISADVTDLVAVENAFARVKQVYGDVNILVLNAGGTLERSAVESSDPEKWAGTLALNLTGAYYCVRAAIPYMKVVGGTIITLGSGRGHRPKANTSGYSCAKAGLWMLTRILAEELRPYDIIVNELIPGPVLTEGFNQALVGEDLSKAFPQDEWFKQPEDVVPLALFLASQSAKGPTGQCFSLMRRDSL